MIKYPWFKPIMDNSKISKKLINLSLNNNMTMGDEVYSLEKKIKKKIKCKLCCINNKWYICIIDGLSCTRYS